MASSLSADTAPDLVLRAQAGDRRAASAVCQRFAPAVRAFARRRLVTTEAVDEFTRDVMAVLLDALATGKLEHPDHLPGFVLGICRTFARDRARSEELSPALFDTYAAELAGLSLEVPEKPTYQILYLEDCLASLSERAREVVRLAFATTASPREIAEATSLTENDVRVVRHRALAALRDCMSRRITWEVP